MSELTRCNFCTVERVKRENRGHKVELRPEPLCEEPPQTMGWRVYVDGEPIGMWCEAITDHCVC